MFPLLCRSFLVCYSSTGLFLLSLQVLWCYIHEIITKTNVIRLFFMISFRNFTVSVCTFKSNPFWINFCVDCWIKIQFYSFACDCPIFPTPSVRDYTLSISYTWNPCWTSVDHVCMDLFLGSLFYWFMSLCQFCTVLIIVAL